MATTGTYRFGPFTIDGGAYRLSRGETVLAVTPKVIDLLLYLVHRPSQLVSKDELFAALWPDVAVTDNALTQVVSELRQALGDDPSQPHYIQTVARRGYRFIAPVEAEAPRPAPGEAAAAAADALPAIGVLDFANVTRDPSLDWLASGIAETVTNDLRSSLHARTIDRTRLVQASRRVGMDVEALRRELRLDLAVVGSFQRSADRLRITARALDAVTGEALADSKADGLLTDVFDLQDRIVEQLSAALAGLHGGARHRPIRDTSSLEAYQAFTEGRVRLETLDAAEIPRAIGDFERALVFDPRYAAAHVGLATAHFQQYEMSRARNQPEAARLAQAIDHVRRAIELERDLAEAHATLSFLLVSAGHADEARAAARRAVALEPGYWGHHFRLAHAVWGDDRLRSLGRVMELYPEFPFAHFEAAMVFIARRSFDRAESALREGAVVQDRQAHVRQRYPARGLHWLLGLVRLALGDAHDALREFEHEIGGGAGQVYGAEFVMNAHDGAGFARLRAGEPERASAHFREALALYPAHARSLAGLGTALAAAGQTEDAEEAFAEAAAAVDALRRGGRGSEATIAEALVLASTARPDEAIDCLRRLLERGDLPFAGWTLPIEPLLDPLRSDPRFEQILTALADRAR